VGKMGEARKRKLRKTLNFAEIWGKCVNLAEIRGERYKLFGN